MFDDEADFALRLISTLNEASEKSIIFSPTSILMGLAMFYVGCDGETAAEIEEFIGKGKSGLFTPHVKAPWKLIFEDFKEMDFKSNPTRKVKMMCRKITTAFDWNYVESENWAALGIPYENYKAWINSCPYLNVAIPFIDVTYDINMNENLQKLGMKTAFTKNCNVSKMTKFPLFLKKVLHKCVIKIDEKGTEASAASSAFINIRSMRQPKTSFIADRPFLYFIVTTKEKPRLPKKDSKSENEEDAESDDDQSDMEEDVYYRECATEPLNLLFVGTYC
uniref:Serpin domain-containing protein n=1 Tax=Panagrolaimus sp. ES5 TaxID=591445 RepID=A0AC34FNK7_9BILA